MTVYIATFLLICLMAFLIYSLKLRSDKKNLCFWLCSSLTLSFISGLRGYSVGADTHSYAEWYTYLNSMGWHTAIRFNTIDIEPGYKIFNLLLGKITQNPRIVIFVSSAIIIFSLTTYLKKYSDDLYLSVVLLLGLNHFFTSINTYRTYLALAIVLWSIPALLKKKFGLAAFLMFLGFNFHRTSIVFSGAVLLGYILRKKRKNIIIAFIVELMTLPFVSRMMNIAASIFPKYGAYLEDNLDARIGILNVIFFSFDIIIILYLMTARNVRSEMVNMQIILLSLLAVLRIVGHTIPRGFRLVQILDFSVLLLIPFICCRDKVNLYIYRVLISVGAFMLYVYYLCANAGEIVPYVFLK